MKIQLLGFFEIFGPSHPDIRGPTVIPRFIFKYIKHIFFWINFLKRISTIVNKSSESHCERFCEPANSAQKLVLLQKYLL